MKKFILLTLCLASIFILFSITSNTDTPALTYDSQQVIFSKEQKENLVDQESNTSTKKYHKNSAQKVMNLFFKTLTHRQKPQQLIIDLQNLDLTPIVQKEGDQDFGEAYIIRTKNSLPGTRYLHAQYEPDEQGTATLQHLSIELPPGPDAMSTAIDLVQQYAGKKLELISSADDFIRWKIPRGKHIWIKIMDMEYMKSIELFNAYTKDDIGTVRIVIEDDQHPQGHQHPLDE